MEPDLARIAADAHERRERLEDALQAIDEIVSNTASDEELPPFLRGRGLTPRQQLVFVQGLRMQLMCHLDRWLLLIAMDAMQAAPPPHPTHYQSHT
jgi:hypothetical protein